MPLLKTCPICNVEFEAEPDYGGAETYYHPEVFYDCKETGENVRCKLSNDWLDSFTLQKLFYYTQVKYKN